MIFINKLQSAIYLKDQKKIQYNFHIKKGY